MLAGQVFVNYEDPEGLSSSSPAVGTDPGTQYVHTLRHHEQMSEPLRNSLSCLQEPREQEQVLSMPVPAACDIALGLQYMLRSGI